MRAHLLALLVSASALAAWADSVPPVTQPGTSPKATERSQLRQLREPTAELSLEALGAAAKSSAEAALEPNQVGISRRKDVESRPAVDENSLRWESVDGRMVAQLRVSVPGAEGMRVGLRFEALPKDLQIRVAEPDAAGGANVVAGTSTALLAKLHRGVMPIEHWTASTEGQVQVIEFTTRHPASLRFRVIDVSHMLRTAEAVFMPKVDKPCHIDSACVSDSSVLDNRRAVARMRFVKNGSGFVCTGALLNDRVSSFTPIFATANHCISTSAVAATLETWWFYYPSSCGGAVPTGTRLNTGAAMILTDFDTDFTLLRLSQAAPGGARFLGWDSNLLAAGQGIYGLHHPAGEFQRYSAGVFVDRRRVTNSATGVAFGQLFNRIRWTQGITEGGSSGSPLITAPGSFRGTLFGSPSTNACGGAEVTASYSDFNVVYPLIRNYLEGPTSTVLDDYGDNAGAATAISTNADFAGEIQRPGDQDWFRYTLDAGGDLRVRSLDAVAGVSTDLVGTLYASNGTTILATNDDRVAGDLNFEVSARLSAGTYYLKVAGFDTTVGRYRISSRIVPTDDHGDSATNASALASTGSQSGFLGSGTDQDWFRVSFSGAGVFTVSSNGSTDVIGRIYQSDGVTLVSENDDANPPDTNFSMTVNVNGPATAYVRVTGYDGALGGYGLATSFAPTATTSANYTDLWWNPAQNGWGMNINQQGDTMFATVFTYSGGRDTWVVASGLARQSNGTFTGPYYRTVGQPYNAATWSAPSVSEQGQMTLEFTSATTATLRFTGPGISVTHSMQRQVFSTPPVCTFTTASRTGATNYQDLWWNPAESGWGINVTHQGAIVFATLFAYASDNQPMWLVASSLPRQPDGSYFGPLYRTSGGSPYTTTSWTGISVTEVGTMRLRFSSGTAATLTYTFNGATVTKQIERQVFGSPATVCQ